MDDRRVDGWKDISKLVGMSETWCMKRARKDRLDPLPVFYLGEKEVDGSGKPSIMVSAYLAWLKRRQEAGGSSSPIGEG